MLNGSGSHDPDGDNLTYFWEQLSGAPVSISNPTSERASFTAPSTSSSHILEFQLTVSDGTTSATDSVVINVGRYVPPLPPQEQWERLGAPTGFQRYFEGSLNQSQRYTWNLVPNARAYRISYVHEGSRRQSDVGEPPAAFLQSVPFTGVRIQALANASWLLGTIPYLNSEWTYL